MPQDLCTFEDVQGLVGSDVADLYTSAQLEALCDGTTNVVGIIPAQSRFFEQQVGRSFEQQSKVFYLSGKGTNMVMLPEVPQLPITSMALEYQAVGEGWTSTTNFSWTDAGVIRLTGAVERNYGRRSNLPRFSYGVNNVKATVVFGSNTVPSDVRMAVAYLCAIDILGRYSRWLDKGIKDRQLGDRRENYGSGGRFSQDMERWQTKIDDTIATWSGGIQAAPGYRTG